ncbi:TonB-dependent receptor plug domain-containing protein [Plastoroseomonas arctica]|uniref:TonB-dependent receptor n=1 Tax=Plastoroseomonas arctica TaxID=1509237 RepID=A0AAF1JZ39_9PROT|nr:TonB-dependent receptor [Plastoroseomonas arctica]MBR0656761.1 TonB-dependent receptor [Plastoroseomonas arctica]
MRRLALLLTTALSLPAYAQPAPTAVPDTIVRAAAAPTTIERVPAGVTVITRQQIQERGYQSLAEALFTVPGINISPTGGLGQQTSIFTRGTNSNHTLVLIDGIPVNDPSTPAGAFDFGQDLLGDIERIEIIRGPFSSLYGSGALGGAINLVTRRAPADREATAFGELAGGSNRTVRANAGLAGTVGAFDYLAVGQTFSSQGSDANAPRIIGHNGERDGYRAVVGTLRLGWQATDALRFEALLRFRETNYQFDAAGAEDPNATGSDRAWLGSIRGEARLLDGAWTTGLRLSRTEQRRRALDAADGYNPFPFNPYSLFLGTRTNLEWGNQIRLPELRGVSNIVFSFGAGVERQTSRSEGRGVTLTDAGATAYSLFTGIEGRVANLLDLSAALRHEEAEDYGGATTWRLGAVLPIESLGLRAHAAIGTAFRAPSLEERFGVSSFVTGNRDLKPEHALGYEAGLAWRPIPQVELSGTYFGSRIKDLIVLDFASIPGTSRNIARARIDGAELALAVMPVESLQLRGSWTITEAFDDTTDRRLLRRPSNTIAGGITWRPIEQVTLAAEARFTGAQNDFVYTPQARFGTRGVNPSGTVANFTGTWRVQPGVEIFAEGRNLGNTRYEPVNSYAVPGRSVLVGTRISL